jgi:FMN phosphatase YigB (HAD superfamily)
MVRTRNPLRKPDRRIFEAAIRRLGLVADLGECLFITEESDHISRARQLHMKTLHFGGVPPEGFDTWTSAVPQIAALVADASPDV